MNRARTPVQPPDESQPAYAAPALEKGLDILELLAGAGATMSTKEIVEELRLSRSQIFRVVYVLIQRGYLMRQPGTDRLALTRRLFDIGIRTPRGRELNTAVLPHMERFSAETAHIAHLVVISRGETVVLAKTSGYLDASVSVRLGYGRPALEANSGVTILAFQSEESRLSLIGDAITQLDEKQRARLTQTFSAIRRAGSFIAPSRDLVGVKDIICPVLNTNGEALACLTVPCLQRRGAAIDEEGLRARLAECCKEAEAEL